MPAYLDPVEEAQIAAWVLMDPEPLQVSEEVIIIKCEITIAARDGLQPGFDIRKLDRAWLRAHAEEIQRLVRQQVRYITSLDENSQKQK